MYFVPDRFRQWLSPQNRGRRLPDVLATIGLLSALAGAGVLTVQAYQADNAQRAATVRGLQHLASVAAWEFARQAGSELEHIPRMTLWTAPAPAAPTMDHAAHATTHCATCAPPLVGSALFAAGGRIGALALAGEVPAGVSPEDLLAVAERAARELGPGGTDGTVVLPLKVGPTSRRVVAAMARRTSASDVSVSGLVAPGGWLEQVLARAASRKTLPPVLLSHETELDSALVVTVRTSTGEAVFRSGTASPAGAAFTGTASLADDSLIAEVTIAPPTAAALAAFVPRARPVLPLLVFVLTAIVLVLAAAQQRRSAELARQRADFLASVSHDLNTPLALVTVHAETLLKPGAVSESERDVFAQVIVREARRLSQLVDNAIRFTDIDRRPLRLTVRRLDLATLLRDVVADFRPLAGARGATLSLIVELPGPVAVDADRDAMRQVLFNLLDNAVKYGPAGQAVVVRAHVAGDAVSVAVDDEGPGIPHRDRNRVFGRFVRLRGVDGGAPAGSGIGLAVVHDLCTRMGVTIDLATAPGGGTRATVQLPRSVPGPAESEPGGEGYHAATVTD